MDSNKAFPSVTLKKLLPKIISVKVERRNIWESRKFGVKFLAMLGGKILGKV
jgi:hypothetical protein